MGESKAAGVLKAWGCCDHNALCGYIVLAPTRGKAHSLAMGLAGFDWSDWNEVSVTRIPALDGLRSTEGPLNWDTNGRAYYEAGWFPVDGAPCCDCCGLYEYAEFPESKVVEAEDGDMCANCREATANRSETEG